MVCKIDAGDLGSPHAGLDQAIDDRPVAPRAIALATGPLVGELDIPAPAPIAGAPAEDGQMVGSIKQAPTLVRSEGALELQDAVQGEALQLLRRVPQGKGPELSDPLGEGLEVRRHPVDRAVGVVARAVLVDLSAQRFDERPAEIGGPGAALERAGSGLHKAEKQRQIPALLLLRARAGRHLEAEIVLRPKSERVSLPRPSPDPSEPIIT